MVRKNILKKQKIVDELAEMIKNHKTVAIASIDGVPASVMQNARKELKGRVVIRVVKRRLLIRALEKVKEEIPHIEELEKHAEGQVAVLFSDEDPFRIFKELKKFKVFKPVKPGMVAPTDIIVPKGITGVPAPAIAEIKAAGIPSKITKGFIEVTEDYVAAKAGEVVTHHLANALAKLEVFPIEASIFIRAAWNDGIVFPREVLDVSVEQVLENVRTAAANALNLAVNIGYPTRESMPLLIAKAHMEALNLALNAKIVNKESAPYILAEARAHALALASRLPADALDEETRQAVQAAASTAAPVEKVEEKKEEKPSEEEENKEEEAAAGLASLFG